MSLAKQSLTIGTFLGIPVRIHWTFSLLLLSVSYMGWSNGYSLRTTGMLFLLVSCVFVCVVLHEYGHAIAARRYGIKTEDIILTPIGGIARILEIPKQPIREIIVAVAGPLVNVLIASFLLLVIWISPLDFSIDVEDETHLLSDIRYFPSLLISFNVILLLFNMIPALPMDGGRVLRGLLCLKLSRLQATRIASWVGQVITVGFMIFGIWQGHWTLAFIGLFIFYSARSEYRMVAREAKLDNTMISDIMLHSFSLVTPMHLVKDVEELMQRTGEREFLVENMASSGHVIGALHKEFIDDALKYGHKEDLISAYVHSAIEYLSPHMTLREVIQKFKNHPYSILPVRDDDSIQIIGVVTRTVINDYLA